MAGEVTFQRIEHGSEVYRAAIALRDEVLANPMRVVTTPQDILAEKDLIHVVGFLHSEDGEICATCLLVPEGDRVVRMKRVAVAPSAQNQGVGSAMLQFCEFLCRGEGATEIYAHARRPAVAFYRRAGYTIEGGEFEEVGIPHQLARKIL